LAKARNSIIISGIVLAFIAGTFVSGTQAFGAAQSGWQKAVDDLQGAIDAIGPHYTDADAITAVGPHTDDTNAGTECAPGQFLNGDGTCDPVTTGDITGVAAGTGLTGGGLSGAVTVNADTNFLQKRVSGTCSAGSSIRVISSSGAVTCEPDNDTIAISNFAFTSFSSKFDEGTETKICPFGKLMTGFSIKAEKTTVGGAIDNIRIRAECGTITNVP